MFTGIISDIVDVKRHRKQANGLLLTLEKPTAWQDLALGESVATNGPCLTVAAIRQDEYDCFLVPETLAKTSFGQAVPSQVNLERSLSLSDRLGGHFVQGHVDCVGTVAHVDDADGRMLTISFPADFAALIIAKGSICINGVSLTVARLDANSLSVALIPHTLTHTTLGTLQVGDTVNLEFDMIGKYIVRQSELTGASRSKK